MAQYDADSAFPFPGRSDWREPPLPPGVWSSGAGQALIRRHARDRFGHFCSSKEGQRLRCLRSVHLDRRVLR
jgi:hypothetical protein